jgi:hypothetical protein
MVQPAENISRSYPAIGWQLMPMDARARPRPAVGIRNAWPQARVGSSLIVMGNPLPQDRPKMLLVQPTLKESVKLDDVSPRAQTTMLQACDRYLADKKADIKFVCDKICGKQTVPVSPST